MKKLLSAGLAGTLMFGANFSPYFAYIDYNKNTNKNYANVFGFYFSNFKKPYKTEIDAEYTKLDYKDTPTYNQKDLTVIVNYFKDNNYKWRAGIHNIFSTNTETIIKYQPKSMFTPATTTTTTKYNNSYDYVLFAGFMYYEYLRFNAAVDVYVSDYEHLNVYQITPKYGYNFGEYNSISGSFYVEGKLNYIKLSNKEAAPKESYTNIDLKVQNFKGPWITTLQASFGKSAYKVDNDGFVVYNLGEEYKNIYSLAVGKKLSKDDYIEGKIAYGSFEETEGYEASSTSLVLSYSHSF